MKRKMMISLSIILTLCILTNAFSPVIAHQNQDRQTENTTHFPVISFLKNLSQRLQSLDIINLFISLFAKTDSSNEPKQPTLLSTQDTSNTLVFTKTDGLNKTDYVNPTEIIHYNITIENPTQNTYEDVKIQDMLPSQVTYLNSDPPGNEVDGIVQWNIGTVQPDEIKTIWLNVTANADSETGIEITNTVELNYSLGPFSGTETAYDLTMIGQPSYQPISITKDNNCINDAVLPEGEVNYTITITNPNRVTIYDVWLNDFLPENVTYQDCSQEDFFSIENRIITWNYNDLSPNETKQVWIRVKANDSLDVGDEFVNSVTVNCVQTGSNTTNEVTTISEDIAPVTTLSVGIPQVDELWVTTQTPITLHSTDNTEVDYLYYRIEWNNAVFETQIIDNSPDDFNTTEGIIETTITFNETCTHTLTYYAVDNTGTVENQHIDLFYVDETPPALTQKFQGSIDPYFYKQGNTWYTGMARSTQIQLLASGTGSNQDNGCNGGVGFDHIGYRWYAGDELDDLEKITDITVDDATVSLDLNMSLWHRVEYWTQDYLGNKNPGNQAYKSMDILVDDEGPITTSSYDGLFYEDEEGTDWITSNTNKIIESTDSGGIPGGSGVQKIGWHIDKKTRDEWTTVQQGTVYDNDVNDIDGTPAHPEQGNLGGLWAYDYKDEPYIFQDTNQNWSYDEGETVIEYDPDGDGFIDSYIANPNTGDEGGLWAMDSQNEPYIFQDHNGNSKYDEENDTIPMGFIENNPYLDPDEDALIDGEWIEKYVGNPQNGDKGGLYAYDETKEPYVYQDTILHEFVTPPDWWPDNLPNPSTIQELLDALLGLPEPPEDWPSYIKVMWYFIMSGGDISRTFVQYFIDTFFPSLMETTQEPNWQFDRQWIEEYHFWISEPIVTLKPDYDGAGTIKMNLSILEDSEHRFYYQAFDWFGNPGKEHNQYVRVDNTPPQSLIETSNPQCSYYDIEKEEYVYCVTTESRITLHTQDEYPQCNVGIDTLHYTISKNDVILEEREIPQKQYYFYFDSFGEGCYNVTYFATDLLGNTEPIRFQRYCVDNTPPSVSIEIKQPNVTGLYHEPDCWITSDSNISVKVMQSGCCPILSTRFRVNKGEWHLLNSTEATRPNGTQIPSSFFENEQRYEIEIEANNCYLPPVITRKVVYVDNSPPDISVMNPQSGGYYREGDVIPSVVFAEDWPLNPLNAEPVGISQGKEGNAMLIDIYPDFTILPLMNVDFIFDPEHEGSPFFQGRFKIIGSENVLNDGPVLFVVEIEDDLGNYQNSILSVLRDYANQSNGDLDLFESLINADEGINDDVVWLNIDNDESEDDDDDEPTGVIDSISFISPVTDTSYEEDTVDIRLQTTGTADPDDVTVMVTIKISDENLEFTRTATYDSNTDKFVISGYDISYVENNSEITFEATASDAQANLVYTSNNPTLNILNDIYFSTYLESGWNPAVTFDDIKGSTKVDEVFNSILDDVSLIFEEDETGNTGKYFIPGQNFNTLKQVDEDKIYKIKMKNAVPLFLENE